MANGQQLRLKIILNVYFSYNYFSPISLNNNCKKDKYLIDKSRKIKIRITSFKNTYLIIWFFWSNFYFLEIKVDIYRNDHIKKNENNLGIDTVNIDRDRGIENLIIGIININRIENSGISISNINKA